VVHHGEEQQLISQGKKARVSAPWKLKASASQENGFPMDDNTLEEEIQKAYDSLPKVEFEGHTGQIQDVLKAIAGEKELLIDGIEGRRTLEFITAIYQSASQGQTVKLPLTEESPF
ncbi:Gfo/Idh/MocA family oxidoreductase, partial [Pseudomonas sp. 2995-3]|uniref:Gfo/Idh/MocA family oxidoreductase n=1 Tax=Pseudomonas sp. 2995-3 TaxID=1712680 RepID=UPI000C3CDB9E